MNLMERMADAMMDNIDQKGRPVCDPDLVKRLDQAWKSRQSALLVQVAKDIREGRYRTIGDRQTTGVVYINMTKQPLTAGGTEI